MLFEGAVPVVVGGCYVRIALNGRFSAAVSFAAACGLLACAAPDANRLGETRGGSGGSGATEDGGAGSGNAASGGSGGLEAGSGGSGGSAGMAGMAGMAGSGGGECVPNPDTANEVCTEICPERCNGEDDDCDRKLDEGEADADCQLAHATSTCVRGECLVVTCEGEFRDCDQDAANGCEALLGSVEHCAACYDACSFPNSMVACFEGQCLATGCQPGHGDCDTSLDSCETPLDTLIDCGVCGASCDALDRATPTCATGSCAVDTCIGNYGNCNGVVSDGCEEPLDSLEHCGGCGTDCSFMGTTSDCSSGSCVALGCETGYANCDGDTANGCESLNGADHCGGCGMPCNVSALANVAAASCESQACSVSCKAGHGDCDQNSSNGCETPLTSNVNCGNCGDPCDIPHAVAECGTGSCEFVSCVAGWGDCNDDLSDGCELDLNTTLSDCGACDHDCQAQSVPKQFCVGGSCSGLSCAAGTAECDGNEAMPCEVTLSAVATCGSCTNACAFNAGLTTATAHGTLACAASGPGYACDVVCATGYDDCDGNYKNGCETSLASLTNCGSCGQGCSIPNAVETCVNRVCEVQACDPDWGNCDANPNTCERALNTTSDCGACNAGCNLAFAVEACGGSAGSRSCIISSCSDADHKNCDNQAATGCEVNATNTVAHCGACNNDCNSLPNVQTTSCTASACNISQCDPGFGNCTGAAGCETAINTVQNCGACNNDCSALANTASVSCSGGTTCAVTGCDPGYANCNGAAADGCETDTYTLANCGGCANLGLSQNCSALPHVALASCGAGACQVQQCASGYADCNGLPADGCEHDLATLGACDPDTNCTKSTWATNGHTYWVCNNARPWSEARARCLMLNQSDLVDLGSAAENAFVTGLLAGSNRWLGGNDQTLEGTWRWAGTNVPFWVGVANGSVVAPAYKNWVGGEPNEYGAGEDCSEIRTDGLWNDQSCAMTMGFVCEVKLDACASDPAKYDPGQCGCGIADTDTDGDLIANCIDACPNDATKRAVGVCGCGIADTDSDGDGFANCIETCDSDPLKQDPGACDCGTADTDGDGDGTPNCNDLCPVNAPKTAPGVCGCAVADADSDGDGTPNCNDGCPNNPATTSACFPYTPTNYDPGLLNFGSAPTTTLNCGITTVDTTTTPATLTNWCGTAPTPVVQGAYAVIPLNGLTIPSTHTLRVIGTRPLIVSVLGNVSIQGTVDANASGATPGAGGNQSCGSSTGANGFGNPSSGSGGGGGGGHHTLGGKGGYGDSSSNYGGNGGAARALPVLSPLTGGCAGGLGGGCTPLGGAGGGAVQFSVSGTFTASGVLRANGGNGQGGCNDEGGASGGGSGGGLLFEAVSLNFTGATITARGGNGGTGASGGSGGGGSTSAGANGMVGENDSGDGGGGGGGGYGRVRSIANGGVCTACP
jgi:hypothetical protein